MPKLLDKTCRNYMRLDKLSIINYKNIEAATLNLSAKLNCFIGHNGVGKTNLLDAVYWKATIQQMRKTESKCIAV